MSQSRFEKPMRILRVEAPSPIREASMWLVLPPGSRSIYRGELPLHETRQMLFTTCNQDQRMAENIPPIYRREAYLPILDIYATCHVHPARYCQGKSDRSVSCPGATFRLGASSI